MTIGTPLAQRLEADKFLAGLFFFGVTRKTFQRSVTAFQTEPCIPVMKKPHRLPPVFRGMAARTVRIPQRLAGGHSGPVKLSQVHITVTVCTAG